MIQYIGLYMPKDGYTAITVPESLHDDLKRRAESRNLSIPAYLKILVENNEKEVKVIA
jgi:hypothetical protein